MASQFPKRQKDLIAALQGFIQNIDSFDAQQVTKALHEFSTELSQLTNANCPPQTQIHKIDAQSDFDSEPIVQASMHYPAPEALARELPALLELRGICLITEERPPLMDWLHLRLTCAEKTDSVDLVARVVQHTSDGFALEIEPVSPQVRAKLLKLAEPSTKTNTGTPFFTRPTNDHSAQFGNKFLDSEGEPLARYNLEQTDLETILLEISHRRGFGLLQIQHAAHTWQLVYLHHQIVDIQHFPLREAESLAGLLLESKNISRDHYDKAQAYAQSHDIEPENALVALGFLSETQLAQAHKARIMLLLQRLLERSVGHVAHFGLTYPPPIHNHAAFHELALVSIPARVFHHIHARYQKLDPNRLLVAAQRFNNRTLSIHESLYLPIHALNLDDQLKAVVDSISSEKQQSTLPQIIQAHTLPPSRIVALCLALERLGLIKLTAQKPQLIEPEPQTPTEHQTGSAPPDDHFSRLGLHWSTYDQEIQRQYHQLNQQHLASNHPENAPDNPEFLALTQAYEAIRNPTHRARYRSSIIDSYTIENALQNFRNQAENAKLNRDIDAAIDACCRIIELDPDDSNAREDLKTLRPLKLWSNSQQPDQSL